MKERDLGQLGRGAEAEVEHMKRQKVIEDMETGEESYRLPVRGPCLCLRIYFLGLLKR